MFTIIAPSNLFCHDYARLFKTRHIYFQMTNLIRVRTVYCGDVNLNKYLVIITSLLSIEVCKIRLCGVYLKSYLGNNRLQCEANVVPAR